jgi:hypothetical protein
MGQLVGVVEKRSATPGVVRFELNRSLSGMGHERFGSTVDAIGATPSASLARQLFATGKVDSVHIYGNIVTVDIGKGHDSSGLADIVREMYRYWKPGVEPPVFDDAPADETGGGSGGESPATSGDGGGGSDGGAQLSEAAKRIPAHLLERSQAALAKWKANNPG